MEIRLNSETDISGWNTAFSLLKEPRFVRLWQLVNVPQDLCRNPSLVSLFARRFLARETGLIEFEDLGVPEMHDRQESIRLIHLGHLCEVFGMLTFCFGETNANELFEWGERIFTHHKSTFWWEWYYFLTSYLPKESELRARISEGFEVLESLQNRSTRTLKRKLLEARKQESQHEFRDFSLENIEQLLEREFAFQLWREINRRVTKESRLELFSWGSKKSRQMGSQNSWRGLKEYCLSV